MSSVEVEILGEGAFAGSRAEIVGYTASESASPINLNDLQGGVGRLDFTVVEDASRDGTILLPGQPFMITDPYAGAIRGVVDEVSVIDEAGASVTGSPHLLPLVAERAAPAYSGSLGGALNMYIDLAADPGDIPIQIDPEIAAKQVALAGWTGEVWEQIKKLAAIQQFEIAAVADATVVRKLRTRWLEVGKYTSLRTSTGGGEAAREVEVHYYNTEWRNSEQIHPNPETSITDRPIISAEAGETVVTNVPVNMWIGTLQQPNHVLTLPWDYTSDTSVYSVVDKEGDPVTPGDWANGGGMVSFEIGADGRSVDITVRGMITNHRAPYRIASSSQDREYQFPALYIAASGVHFDEQVMSTRTGANEQYLPVDSVVVIDEPMVSTRDEAAAVMMNAALALAGEVQSLEAGSTAVNRRGETGEIVYPSFGEFDAAHPTETFGDFDAIWGTETFGDFDAAQAELVAGNFESQAFGGIGGARARYRDAIYRAVDATVMPGSFHWTAMEDTTFGDFDSAMEQWDPTFGEYDLFWGDRTFSQVARQSLAAPLL